MVCHKRILVENSERKFQNGRLEVIFVVGSCMRIPWYELKGVGAGGDGRYDSGHLREGSMGVGEVVEENGCVNGLAIHEESDSYPNVGGGRGATPGGEDEERASGAGEGIGDTVRERTEVIVDERRLPHGRTDFASDVRVASHIQRDCRIRDADTEVASEIRPAFGPKLDLARRVVRAGADNVQRVG